RGRGRVSRAATVGGPYLLPDGSDAAGPALRGGGPGDRLLCLRRLFRPGRVLRTGRLPAVERRFPGRGVRPDRSHRHLREPVLLQAARGPRQPGILAGDSEHLLVETKDPLVGSWNSTLCRGGRKLPSAGSLHHQLLAQTIESRPGCPWAAFLLRSGV